MALTGKTIGQLDHLTSSLTGNEAFPIQYNGATYHISQSQIIANLATTGSNRFIGNQIITGSLIQGGVANIATGLYSHAEGNYTQAIGLYSHAEGYSTFTGLPSAFSASISNTTVTFHSSYGNKSLQFTNGNVLVINEVGFPGCDFSTITSSSFNGINTIVEIEGVYNLPNVYVGNRNENVWLWDGDQKIPGDYAHSEGNQTYSPGVYSKSSGHLTTAYGYASHAEGGYTRAIGSYSHAEGSITKAIGDYSHAEGDNTQAVGNYSHTEGQETIASGQYSHAEGYNTIASASHQHVQGQWNAASSVPAAFIVGNGTGDDSNRSNLIHAAGNEVQISGSLNISGSITGSLFGTASYASTASSADNFLVRGTLTAQTIVAQTITSSTEFITGSTKFGSLSTDTHQFTGSVLMTGSLNVIGNTTVTGSLNIFENTGSYFNFSNGVITIKAPGGGNDWLAYLQASGGGQFRIGSTAGSANGTLVVGAVNASGQNLSISPGTGWALNLNTTSNGSVNILASSGIGKMYSSGNFMLALTTASIGDIGYRFSTFGSGSASGSLYSNGLSTFTGNISGSQPANNPSSSLILISGSIRPTGSLTGASTILMNTVMSASANNQTLVGLDITPTFDNGAFTGITNTGLRIISGSVNLNNRITLFTDNGGAASTNRIGITPVGASTSYIEFYGSSFQIRPGSGTVDIKSGGNASTIIKAKEISYSAADSSNYTYIFGNRDSNSNLQLLAANQSRLFITSSGNVFIQEGTPTTDNGYRLQINGSGSLSGSLYVSGSSVMSGSLNVIGNTTITGSLLLSTGSMFGLPTTSSVTPVTGSMFWSGSLLFIYNGTRYMSASFV